MQRTPKRPPLRDQIVTKIDEVVRLLRQEAREHSDEHWDAPIGRIRARTGLSISLVEVREALGDRILSSPHGNLTLGNAIHTCFVVVSESHANRSMPMRPGGWRFEFQLGVWSLPEEGLEEKADSTSPSAPAVSRTGNGKNKQVSSPLAAIVSGGTRSNDPQGESSLGSNRSKSFPFPQVNEAWLVRELDRRERERGPIFAGFIVNDLLPRRGFEPADAKRILSAMEAQNMVHTERKPSPNDPARSTTFVTLNREHPHVAQVLKGAAGIERTFPIGTIKGELLSERIIRERL